jgi:hypothetical protein
MSSNIEIKSEGCKTFSLEIKSYGIEFEMWDHNYPEANLITMFFSLKDKEDIKALQKLSLHLKHQLETYNNVKT